ncbi:MAG: hypothetical protein KC468_02520 [Myxococcales bacterium]|nr:hypothetical protein [Myxococcales bacterium]
MLETSSQPPDGERLDEDTRSHVRFFAYWIGNSTLLINIPDDLDDDGPEYLEDLARPGPLLGELFAVFVTGEDHDAAARWLYDRQLGRHAVTPVIPAGVPAWRRALASFARDLGARTLEPELLAEVDVGGLLSGSGGSGLEFVFAVFTNSLRLEPAGGALRNEAWARRRGAQAARAWLDRSYSVSPPWARWETELV